MAELTSAATPSTRVSRGSESLSVEMDALAINAIRFLAVDMVQKAKSGHPGAPMGMATLAYTLWTHHLRHNPSDPTWADRDRFILSAGHASAMLYALLYLTGYDLPLDELKRFRQLDSKTPGHPESHLTPGVEATTGPLGQGFANGVGMAIAEAVLAKRFNVGAHRVVDHHVYAICSDGDLQEGLSSEAASLAGTLKLGKLVYLYDDNGIQIDGSTDASFRENVGDRFRAFDWHVVGPIDGHNMEAVDAAITEAKAARERPSLIVCETTIGYGSPNKAGTSAAHGAPLGDDEVAETRVTLGWSHPPFVVPEPILTHMRRATVRGAQMQAEWERTRATFASEHPKLGRAFEGAMAGALPEGWADALTDLFPLKAPPSATRGASGIVLNALAPRVPTLMGGSADLAGSNMTTIKNGDDFSAENRAGRNLHFGVREHTMGAVASGMALHGGIIPYTGTFLTFSDYMRPAIRLAALQALGVIYVFSHDSIGLGEDGPTHQPIEHLASLRAIPNLAVIRPGDAHETAEAWRVAMTRRKAPTALVFSRQKTAEIDRTRFADAKGLVRGAYVLYEPDRTPDVILLSTGTELGITLAAGLELSKHDIAARVVSMPCWELFEAQPATYRAEVLPPDMPLRLAVEAGVSQGWRRWTGDRGDVVSIERFGASAPWEELYAHFGFTVANVVARAQALVDRGGR